MTPKIVNIIVCYNNPDEIKDYLKELASLDKCEEILVVIVENAESPQYNFCEEANNSRIQIRYIRSPKNIGYMKGLLYGYKMIENEINPEWVVLSNSDIQYPQKNIFLKLLEKEYKDVCCIGPDIFVPETGEHQNPGVINRFTRHKIKSYCAIFSNVLTGGFYIYLSRVKKKLKHFTKDHVPKNIYLVHGAYMIVSPQLMSEMTNFEFKPFLYNEELYVSEMAIRIKKNIYYDPNLQIIHNEHSVTKKLNVKKKAKLLHESYLWIRNTFFAEQ